jgi:hypothetical protein
MYVVGTFQQPSVYAGRRAIFDAQVLTIEGVGPVDVRTLPGFAASGQFAYADAAARIWTENASQTANAAYAAAAAPARGKGLPVPWIAGIAAVVVVAGVAIAIAMSRPTPGPIPPYTPPVKETSVSVLPTAPPKVVVDETSDTVVVPNDTPDVIVPSNDGPAPHARTLPGTWDITSGADSGTSFKFNKGGRCWWQTSSNSWEFEWWTSGTTLTLRRESLTYEYTYKISSDGWTMNWTALNGSGITLLERQ